MSVGIQIYPMPLALPGKLRDLLERISFPTIGHYLEEGFVDPAIHALVTSSKVVGRAITVRITAPDSVLVHKVTEMLEPGDAVVIDLGGDTRHAPVGEIVSFACKSRGAVAIVIDGMCTDIVEIRQMSFPIFARGTSPLTTKLHGFNTGAINAPVTCGGVIVNPGDIVLADDNGVVILAPETAQQIAERALASDAREPQTREYLLQGGSLPERTGANRIVKHLLGG